MTAPTSVAPDQARHDYIARVYKMSHAELFAELMRVHTEANRLVEQAVKDEREACLKAVEKSKVHQFIFYPNGSSIDANKIGEIYAHQHKECLEAVKSRG